MGYKLNFKRNATVGPPNILAAALYSGDEAVLARELVLGHFGLLPGFAKDTKYGLRTYNARSETVDQLVSFKHA